MSFYVSSVADLEHSERVLIERIADLEHAELVLNERVSICLAELRAASAASRARHDAIDAAHRDSSNTWGRSFASTLVEIYYDSKIIPLKRAYDNALTARDAVRAALAKAYSARDAVRAALPESLTARASAHTALAAAHTALAALVAAHAALPEALDDAAMSMPNP